MKKIIIAIACLFLVAAFTVDVQAQSKADAKKESKAKKDKNIWKTLGKITFKKQYDELMGFKVDVPVFSKEVQDLDGKEITVKGYIIPVEGYKNHKEFVFSAFPYNMCFFCGGAGPETVMEVTALEAIKYTAEPITIKGKLQLNSGDINKLIYSMTEVRMVKK